MTPDPHTLNTLDSSGAMQLALDSARQAIGLTEPNPRVGCVITTAEGRVIGQGHTQQAGGAHAEVMALRDAHARGESVVGSVVHVTGGSTGVTIGDDCTVGHLALVHGCTIGNRVLVGMGSTVLDGAVVGDDVVIGAGSLVTPRMQIPQMSMVMGRPARVIRQLSETDLAWVKASVLAYVEAGKAFRQDVEPLG